MDKIGKFAALSLAAALCSAASAQVDHQPPAGNWLGTGTLNIPGSGVYPTWDWPVTGQGGLFTGTFAANGSAISYSGPMYCLSLGEEFNPGGNYTMSEFGVVNNAGWLVDNIILPSSPGDAYNEATTGLQLAIWSVTDYNPAVSGESPMDVLTQYNNNLSNPLMVATYHDYVADIGLLNAALAAGPLDPSSAGALVFLQDGHGGQPQIAGYPAGPNNNFTPGTPGPAAVIPFGLGLMAKFRRRNKSRKA